MLEVHIRRNSDGEVGIYREDFYENWRWQYGEGNYGCDCNRHLFFERAGGRESDEDRECGEELYSVIKIVRAPLMGEPVVLTETDPRDGISHTT